MLAKKLLIQSALCVVLGAVALTGCGQSAKPPKQATPINTQQQVGAVAAKTLTEYLMTTMSSAIVGMNALLEKPLFTKKHIDCFTTVANDKLEKGLQQALQNTFSQQDIKAIDSYLASPLGKKNLQIPQAKLDALLNDKEPVNITTKAEEKQMQAFWQSDVGIKLAGLLGNEDKQLEAVLTAVVKEKESVCQMPKPYS